MEQCWNTEVGQVILLTLPNAGSGTKIHFFGLDRNKVRIAKSRQKRMIRSIERWNIPFGATPSPRILTDVSDPGNTLRQNVRIRTFEKMPEVEEVKLPIATEGLVTSLPIEQHRNAGLSSRPHHTPLRVNTSSPDGFVLMPD